jgi:hypothetical protein
VPGDTPTLPAIVLLPVFVTAEPANIPKLAAVPSGTADWAKEYTADRRNTLKIFTIHPCFFKSPPWLSDIANIIPGYHT